MTEIHGQAAIWLACIEVSILVTCPAARPLIGVSHHKYRGHLQHHQISLTCSSPERRHVLDGDLLDLVLTLPRKQQRAAFAKAWQRYAQTQCHLVKKAHESFYVEQIPSASPTDLIFWTSSCMSNQDLQEGLQQSHDGNELSCDGEVCLIPPAAELGLLFVARARSTINVHGLNDFNMPSSVGNHAEYGSSKVYQSVLSCRTVPW